MSKKEQVEQLTIIWQTSEPYWKSITRRHYQKTR